MEEQKRRVITAFNLCADTYDEPALRCFDLHALALVGEAHVHEGAHVLDVATGTGKVALAARSVVGPRGRVIGIDISEGMLEQARLKSAGAPVEFRQMDAETLEFDDATFDFVLCGFATWDKKSHEPMQECSEPEHLLTVLDKAGFRHRRVLPQPAGYYIQPEDWWTVLWGSAPAQADQPAAPRTPFSVSGKTF